MSFWRKIRNCGSILIVAVLIIYLSYFTIELYTRIHNIRKHERLKLYDKDVSGQAWVFIVLKIDFITNY